MESNEARAALREAERAAAAPYVLRQQYLWWHAALISLAGPLFALSGSGGSWGLFTSAAIVLISVFIILDQRKRRGVAPKGKPPVELRAVYRWYFVGAAVVLVGIAVLAFTTPLWVSLPVSYILCFGGLWWFGAAYERAAEQIRARLS